MEYLADYLKKVKYSQEIFERDCIVSLKIDGKPFQVSYNDEIDDIEYRGRSGNSNKLAPVLTDYDLLFSTGLNKGIKHFNRYKDKMKEYKYICCEVSDGEEIYLLSATTKSNQYIDDNEKLVPIAKKFNIDTMPILFEGKLTDSMVQRINNFIEEDNKPKGKKFKDFIQTLFDVKNVKEFNTLDEIEGVVFNFKLGSNTEQYKIVDPVIADRRTERNAMLKQQNDEHSAAYDEAYRMLYEYVVEYKDETKKKTHFDRLNELFMLICKTHYREMCDIAKQLITNTRYSCFIQQERLPRDMQALFSKNKELLNIYETYIKMFWKPKVRAFVISKEFQNDVNKVIKELQECRIIPLQDYILLD